MGDGTWRTDDRIPCFSSGKEGVEREKNKKEDDEQGSDFLPAEIGFHMVGVQGMRRAVRS